jgi:hypothetical protein
MRVSLLCHDVLLNLVPANVPLLLSYEGFQGIARVKDTTTAAGVRSVALRRR